MHPNEPSPAPLAASFDSVVLAAVVAECQVLLGARVQRVHQVGPDGLALVLRGRGRVRTLLASIHAQWGRVHLTQDVVTSDATPFAHLARSRLEGAALRSIAAPPFERIVTCGFDTLEGPCDLVIEIMGRHSNLILTAGGVIVGALKLVGADRSRVREVLPHLPYVPPPQPRPLPTTITAGRLNAPADRPAWRAVLDAVAGVGPPLAREVCARAAIDPDRPLEPADADAVTAALQAIGETVRAEQFAPVLYRRADGTPAAYAAFPMRVYETLHPEPASMSAAVETVTAWAAGIARIEATRQALASTIAQAAARVRRALDAVASDVRAAADADRLRERGELILAYLTRVAPGATSVEVPGFDGRPTPIALDPTRSGVENAQAYFKRYARAAGARKRLPARQAGLEAERAYLEAAATAIAQADTEDDLWEIEQDLVASGLRKRAGRAGQIVRPKAVSAGRAFDVARGHRVLVGRSGRENEHVTFDVAGPDDLWFHARGMPGAHVILTARGTPPPAAAVDAAARIAAYYSAGRGSGKVPVDITRRRFVRRVRGGRPGQVLYTNERTVTVPPGLPDRARTRPPA